MVFVSTPNPPEVLDIAAARFGTQRTSMRTNLLVHRAGLGEVSKTTFQNPKSTTFGFPRKPDAEGARELTSTWKEHRPDPSAVPGPDFRQMNKLAASCGLTTASQQPSFRSSHVVCLKKGEAVRRATPPLPSDLNNRHVYGMPGTHRTAEQVRAAGPYDPPMKPLVQNQYGADWMRMNSQRSAMFDLKAQYIHPQPTRATRGHQHGAAMTMARTSGGGAKEPFKMSKFTKHAKPVVTKYMRQPTAPASAVTQHEGPEGSSENLAPAAAVEAC